MGVALHCSRWSRCGFCAHGAGSTTDSSGQQAKRVSVLQLTQNTERPLGLRYTQPQPTFDIIVEFKPKVE